MKISITDWSDRLLRLAVVALAAMMLLMSKHAAGQLAQQLLASQPALAHWVANGVPINLLSFCSADWQFAAVAALFSVVRDGYSFELAGIGAKLVLLYGLFVICREVVSQARLPRWAVIPAYALALLMVARLPYLAVLQSGSVLQAAMLGMVGSVAAYLIDRRWRGRMLFVTLVWTANATPAYGYLPALAAATLWVVHRLAGQPYPRKWLRGLVLAQVLALMPLLASSIVPSDLAAKAVAVDGQPRLRAPTTKAWPAAKVARSESAAYLPKVAGAAEGAVAQVDRVYQKDIEPLRPLWLLIGLAIPLSLLVRRIYLRLAFAVSLLALFSLAQLLFGLGPEAPLGFAFTSDLMLLMETGWVGCMVWEWFRQREIGRIGAPARSRWRRTPPVGDDQPSAGGLTIAGK
jgi:hypothetical protein